MLKETMLIVKKGLQNLCRWTRGKLSSWSPEPEAPLGELGVRVLVVIDNSSGCLEFWNLESSMQCCADLEYVELYRTELQSTRIASPCQYSQYYG